MNIPTAETPPLAIDQLRPADTPAYMTPAWLGCIRWALIDPDIVAAFRADTGNTWTPARTPIDAMVDKATGADRDFIEQFIRWTNINVWGSLSA